MGSAYVKGVEMTRKTSAATVFVMTILFLLAGGVHPLLAQGGSAEGGEGSSVRLVVTIAAIWLAIMAAVITVVVVTRRKAGEEERKSKEE